MITQEFELTGGKKASLTYPEEISLQDITIIHKKVYETLLDACDKTVDNPNKKKA